MCLPNALEIHTVTGLSEVTVECFNVTTVKDLAKILNFVLHLFKRKIVA